MTQRRQRRISVAGELSGSMVRTSLSPVLRFPSPPAEGIETHGPFVPYHPIIARQSSAATISDKFTALGIRTYVRSLQVLEDFATSSQLYLGWN